MQATAESLNLEAVAITILIAWVLWSLFFQVKLLIHSVLRTYHQNENDYQQFVKLLGQTIGINTVIHMCISWLIKLPNK